MNECNELFLWGTGWVLMLIAAPVLIGIINKVKAFFAGRKGPRLLQLYYDIAKLLQKKSVYSTTSTGVFKAAPAISLTALLGASLLLPYGGKASPFAFQGDMLLFLYLLGLSRMATVFSAMDVGSSFEGMGASRECQFSAITEGAFLAVLGVLALLTGNLSLSFLLGQFAGSDFTAAGTAMLLIGAAFYVIILAENCRVPVDDPETHLELTMIHEAMILDNGGPDLGLIFYGSALKLHVLLAFLVMMFLPYSGNFSPYRLLWHYAGLIAGAVLIGITESIMARHRFLKVPQLLAGSFAAAVFAVILIRLFR